ncbi:MAG: hypothetical protein J5525_12750 [Lachnospiraceae bacterium]|nr:hypothetical protein [Lachnospiraceae bacterium]
MFTIDKNEFLSSGKCWYKDEFDNTAFLKKEDNVIVGKLRFANKNVNVEPLRLEFPLNETEGILLAYKGDSFSYLRSTNDDLTSVYTGQNNFTELVKVWIGLYYAIQTYTTPNEVLMELDPNLKEKDDVYRAKLALIEQYEELKPLLNNVFNK